MKPYWRQRESVVLRQSARLTADIQRGLTNSFDIPVVVEEFLAAHPVSDNLTPAQARIWARMNIVPNYEALKPALRLVWATGYVFGRDFAKSQYARVTLSKSPSLQELEIAFDTNWDTWSVGNKRSEALVRPPQGLQNLLDAQNITITGIDRTSVDRLGTLLADAVGEGWGADKLSREIKTMLRDPSRALTIARTEMSRASNIASNELWKEYGVAKVEWSEVDGCEYCLANAEAGAVEIGSSFPSGVTEPPAHPNCMCALIPFVDDDDLLGSVTEGDIPVAPTLDELPDMPSIPLSEIDQNVLVEIEDYLRKVKTGQMTDLFEYDAAEKRIKKLIAESENPQAMQRMYDIVKTRMEFFKRFDFTPEQINENITKMFDTFRDKRLVVRIRSSKTKSLLESGRFKTQYETGTSGGTLNTELRANLERAWFGYDDTLDPSLRPVYGYLDERIDIPEVINVKGIEQYRAVEQYGDVQIVLKDSVKNRTTVTIGDSLDTRDVQMPSPISNPQLERIGVPEKIPDTDNFSDWWTKSRYNYVETQMHGGITLDDIESIIFQSEPSSVIRNLLKKNGISYKVVTWEDAFLQAASNPLAKAELVAKLEYHQGAFQRSLDSAKTMLEHYLKTPEAKAKEIAQLTEKIKELDVSLSEINGLLGRVP